MEIRGCASKKKDSWIKSNLHTCARREMPFPNLLAICASDAVSVLKDIKQRRGILRIDVGPHAEPGVNRVAVRWNSSFLCVERLAGVLTIPLMG